jgi:hypothetical protein
MDIVVPQSSPIFKLLSAKDECLVVGQDAFLILNLCLDVLDSVGRLNVQIKSLRYTCNNDLDGEKYSQEKGGGDFQSH